MDTISRNRLAGVLHKDWPAEIRGPSFCCTIAADPKWINGAAVMPFGTPTPDRPDHMK
jgi:hypothetical protein